MQRAGVAVERVTRAGAARALGVDKATVTRLCQANPALLDESARVNVDELRAIRGATINPALQTRAPAGRGRQSSLNDTRERTESAKAETAELDLAERLRMTLRREDVENAVAQAGQVLRQTGAELARDRAEALVRIVDVREMERALDDLVRDMLAKGAQALVLASAERGDERAA